MRQVAVPGYRSDDLHRRCLALALECNRGIRCAGPTGSCHAGLKSFLRKAGARARIRDAVGCK